MSKTTTFSDQTPNSSLDETSRDEEIDSILNDANQLIESVYRNMSNSSVYTSPARTSARQSAPLPLSSRRSLNFGTDEEDALTSRSPVILDMDLEIARINRFCDNVEQNLLPMANRRASLNINNAHLNPILEISDETISPSTSSTPSIIDLSDSSTFVTPRIINRYRTTQNEVIVVDDIVDLCSPTETPPIVNRVRRPQHNSSHCRRQTSLPNTSESLINFNAIKRSPSQTNGPHKRKHGDKAGCSDTTNNQLAYTCPVCMESPLGRAPTSTKCGHIFCASCIKQALSLTHKCPMCNTKLNSRNLIRIYL